MSEVSSIEPVFYCADPQTNLEPQTANNPPPQAVLDSGVTLISVGHRPSLVSFHSRVLQLGAERAAGGGGASWRLCGAAEYKGEGGIVAAGSGGVSAAG